MFLPAPAQAKGQNSKLKKVILVKNIFLLLTSQSVKWCGEQSLGQIRIMNKKQKTVLWTGIAVIVLMGIFPPTRRGYEPGGPIPPGIRPPPGTPSRPIYVIPAHYGYTFLLTAKVSEIGFDKLFLQWAMVAVVTGGLIYAFKDQKDTKPKAEQKQ